MRKRWLLVTLLVVGASVFIYSFERRRGAGLTSAADLPSLVHLAPAASSALFYADIAELRSSPFMMQLAALMPPAATDREYADFVRTTGFDYERDLDRIVITVQDSAKTPIITAIGEGRFDQNKIAAYASRAGKLEKQSDGDSYVIPSKSPGKVVAVRFLDATRIALVSRPANSSRRFPSFPQEPPSNRLSPELRLRLARVQGAPVFAVAKIDPGTDIRSILPSGLRSDQLENLARSVRWVALAASPVGDRVTIEIAGECDNSENARQLAGTLDGLRIMSKMALSEAKTRRQLGTSTLPFLEALLHGVEVSLDDKAHRVRISFVLTRQALTQETK